MSRRRVVAPGQLYRSPTGRIWLVEAVSDDPSGIPHARMRDSRDWTETRTLACPEVLNPDRFTPAGHYPAEGGELDA
ncbi:hypothetical protein [Zavarzinia sp. CC-PAN008]|uniref:hypothetical protein n=1 Tax=Zavarzinia sp. CC-PAN008 TaxID=3243332 RepID=UPI003F742800